MNEKFKAMPVGVKFASVFLLVVYMILCYIAPEVWLGLTAFVGTALSFVRVIHYITTGK